MTKTYREERLRLTNKLYAVRAKISGHERQIATLKKGENFLIGEMLKITNKQLTPTHHFDVV